MTLINPSRRFSTSVTAFHEKAGRSQVHSCCSFVKQSLLSRRVATVRHASIRTLDERFHFARCTLGVLVSAGAAICLSPCGSALSEWNLGQALDAVTGTRLWLLSFPSWNGFVFLRGCCYCRSPAVVQRFVHISAHPQVMQQHGQLSRGGHDGSLLAVSAATRGQLQAPAPQIAVHTEWSQNVLRSLHQQRAQIRIALFADVHLRLALSRVPPSWLQSEITAHVAALGKAMWVLQGQQEGQRDQRAHALDLFQ